MEKLILAGLLFIAGLVLLRVKRATKDDPPVPMLMGIGAVVAFGVAAVILIFSVIVIVPAGHRGVAVTFGEVNMVPLGEGPNIVAPWSDVEDINVRTQKVVEVQEAETKDTQTVRVELMLNWHADPSFVSEVYRDVGPDFADKLIPLATQECLKAEVAKYDVTQIVAQRHVIKAAVETALSAWLDDEGIILDAVAVGNVDFSDAYDQSIEAKQVAAQRAMQAENEVAQARAEAEKVKATAHGAADSQIERARGEAESLRLRGEAQATYNRQVAESLTGPLLQQMYLDRWNGILPATLMGGEADLTMLMPLAQSGGK